MGDLGPVDLTNIEPDEINKWDSIPWLRTEIERLREVLQEIADIYEPKSLMGGEQDQAQDIALMAREALNND